MFIFTTPKAVSETQDWKESAAAAWHRLAANGASDAQMEAQSKAAPVTPAILISSEDSLPADVRTSLSLSQSGSAQDLFPCPTWAASPQAQPHSAGLHGLNVLSSHTPTSPARKLIKRANASTEKYFSFLSCCYFVFLYTLKPKDRLIQFFQSAL